jgi:hypothetical protein
MRKPVPYSLLHDPQLASLTTTVIEAYARKHGWAPTTGTPAVWQNPAFVGDDGTPFILTIPANNAPDFYLRACEIVRQLSQYEEKPEREVLDELLAAPQGLHDTRGVVIKLNGVKKRATRTSRPTKSGAEPSARKKTASD